MKGTIELHGAKQILAGEDNTIIVESDAYIPGDIVTFENGITSLNARVPQAVIGIVEKIRDGSVVLYVPNFGLTSKFRPTLDNDNYAVGERLVIWLNADGTIMELGRYSAEACYDANVLAHMYSLNEDRSITPYEQSENLYTVQEVVDHSDLDTFTIDPTSSVDFDDAISVDVENNTVYVHIVDIAGQPICEASEKRLRERCLTLYLSNERTEHLLEEEEASDKLSLVVGKERKVITVKVLLDNQGMVLKYDIYRSIIVVKRRWNYDEVSLVDPMPEAFRFLQGLTQKRCSEVTYNLNLPSIRFNCTPDGLADSIKTENTNDPSHSMVATAMILANLTVSIHIRKNGKKLPNRFHDTLKGFKAPTQIKTGNEYVDSFILVKRYSRAYYSIDERGHFGLGITDYVHFTSPMRRYADVLVHRILSGNIPNNLEDEVKWLNHRCSVVRSAQDIYINWKVIRWLDANEKRQTVWVTGISKSGVMWFMPSMSLNGFMHVSTLEPKQYWKYDEINATLVGQSNNNTISVGKKLDTTVVAIDFIKGVVTLRNN